MANNRQFPALDIEIDQAMYEQLRRELRSVPDGVRKAEVGAINHTLPKGRTIIVNRLAEMLTAKKANIRQRTDVRKADREHLSGTITIMGRKIALTNFKFTDTTNRKTHTGHGVNVQIFRGGNTLNFPHAFVGTGANNNRQVFQRLPGRGARVGDAAHYKPNVGKIKQKLESIQGESLYDVFQADPSIQRDVMNAIRSAFAEALLSQIDRFLGRRRADRAAA